MGSAVSSGGRAPCGPAIPSTVGSAPARGSITGASGFIGRALTDHYRSTGADVRDAYFDEVVAIHCAVEDVRRSSFRVPFRMLVGDRLVAEGYGVLVGYDYERKAASPLPEDLRASLTA